MIYVVTAPESIRGIYASWRACEAAVKGVSGARFVKVSSREEAEAILSGAGVRLAPGRYLFVDGNAEGGLGVVYAVLRDVEAGPAVVAERGATVFDALAGQGLAGLGTPEEIRDALGRLGNVLAEIAAAWVGLARMGLDPGPVTLVHDYEGVGAWLAGRWRRKDPVVAALVEASLRAAAERGLGPTFVQYPGHRSAWAGRHDYAALNARADQLARAAVSAR